MWREIATSALPTHNWLLGVTGKRGNEHWSSWAESRKKLMERPTMSALHTELGFLEQVSGRLDSAAREYEQAIQANPFDSLALGDLALIKAGEHRYGEAERLWKAAFEHDPVQVGAGLNLAIMECETGNPQAALDSLQRVLEFAPDDSRARNLRDKIRGEKQACAGR